MKRKVLLTASNDGTDSRNSHVVHIETSTTTISTDPYIHDVSVLKEKTLCSARSSSSITKLENVQSQGDLTAANCQLTKHFSSMFSPTSISTDIFVDKNIPEHYKSGEPRQVSIPFFQLQEHDILVNNEIHPRIILERSDSSVAYDIDLGVPIQVYRVKPRDIDLAAYPTCSSVPSCSNINTIDNTNSSSLPINNSDTATREFVYEWESGKVMLLRKSHITYSYTPDKAVKVQNQHSIAINNQLYYIYDPDETSDNVFAITKLFHSVRLLKKKKVLYINKVAPYEVILELEEDILQLELTKAANSNNNGAISCNSNNSICYLQLEKDYHSKLTRYGEKLFTNLMYGQVRSSYPLKKISLVRDKTINDDIGVSKGRGVGGGLQQSQQDSAVMKRFAYTFDTSQRRIALKIFRYNHRESTARISRLHEYLHAHKYIDTKQLAVYLPSLERRNENIIKEVEVINYLTKQHQQQLHQHQHIDDMVLLRDTGISTDHIYTITDLYPEGSLKKFLNNINPPNTGAGDNMAKLDERVVRVIITDLLHSLAKLHSYGIAHQDISIENILLQKEHNSLRILPPNPTHTIHDINCDNNNRDHLLLSGYRFLLIDLGHARAHEYDPFLDVAQRIISPTPLNTLVNKHPSLPDSITGGFKLLHNSTGQQLGKLYYHCPDLPIAPQIFTEKNQYYCGFAVDCWQVGVLMFVLLTGHTPFEENIHTYPSTPLRGEYPNRQKWFELVRNNQLSTAKLVRCDTCCCDDELDKEGSSTKYKYVSLKDVISRSCLDLIEKLLAYNPVERITVDQALNHEWLQEKE